MTSYHQVNELPISQNSGEMKILDITKRRTILGGSVLFGTLLMVALLGRDVFISDAQAVTSMSETESPLDSFSAQWTHNECGTYDDDTVYTNASCSTPDKHASSDHCQEGGWCDTICGTECAEGSCAVCAQMALSNMTKLCDEVHNIRLAAKTLIVQAKPPPVLEDIVDPSQDGAPTTTHRMAYGCDAHTWCRFCDRDCDLVVHWEKQYYGSHIGSGPASMEALNRIEHWCVAWRQENKDTDDA